MGLYEDLLNHHDAKLIAGGAAQNTARGAQYILPPDSVVFIGAVGKDKYAETLRKTCGEAGLRVEYLEDETHPTGRCGVVITGNNRSLCTDLAAANEYKVEHLKSPEIWKLVEQAKFFYVGGYHMTVCVPAITALAEHAAATNKPFILNISAPFIAQFFKEPLDQTLPLTDILLGNETEALAYAESHDLNTKDPRAIATHLVGLPKTNAARPRTVIITQGTEPTIVATADAVGGKVAIKEVPVHVIAKDQICDTNGAGDAFAGGFVAGIVRGEDLDTAVDMGQWLARLGIQELGPSYPFPKKTYAKDASEVGSLW